MKGLITVKDTLSTELENLPGEIWEEVPGYEDRYEVSNYSRVKSVVKRKPVILKKSLDQNSRFKVVLVDRFGRKKNFSAGRLCATLFNRKPEENEVLEYVDGNQRNDQANNTRWVSRRSVVLKTVKRVPRVSGINHGMALINPSKAREIRADKRNGKTLKQLSDAYKVSIPCIQKIVENRTWKTA